MNIGSQLDPYTEDIIEAIANGDSNAVLMHRYNVSSGCLTHFLAKAEHSARVKEARITSATLDADKSITVLEECEESIPAIMKAKELSQAYRWRAKVKSPKEYGDKVEIDGTVTNTNPNTEAALLAIAQRLNSNKQIEQQVTQDIPHTVIAQQTTQGGHHPTSLFQAESEG